MNRRILGLALPNIITNITVPLLGMVDMAIVGRLSASHIGAIAIGGQIFNLIYWNFGFLRMGTSGFTAQAYGAKNMDEAVRIVVRALSIAAFVAMLLLVLQRPLSWLSLQIFKSTPEVIKLALVYFFVRIWAAPATLGLYAVKGWFIGMQNSRLPMWIAIFLNCVNIICSLLFVIVFHWGIGGVALGTVIAQYSGLAVGLFFLRRELRKIKPQVTISMRLMPLLKESLHWDELRRFFKVNGDIFLRTVCLATVFTFITAASGRISAEVLAIDALLMQFFTLFSYIMDGFAYAGESLVGRYIGARDLRNLKLTVRLLMAWGVLITAIFTVLYAFGGEWGLRIFSDKPEIIEGAKDYLFWILTIPVCGFAAFLFDGIYVGATASRTMLGSMVVATAFFFIVYYLGKSLFLGGVEDHGRMWNNILWASFMVYLLLRGLMQALFLKKSIYNQITSDAESVVGTQSIQCNNN